MSLILFQFIPGLAAARRGTYKYRHSPKRKKSNIKNRVFHSLHILGRYIKIRAKQPGEKNTVNWWQVKETTKRKEKRYKRLSFLFSVQIIKVKKDKDRKNIQMA